VFRSLFTAIDARLVLPWLIAGALLPLAPCANAADDFDLQDSTAGFGTPLRPSKVPFQRSLQAVGAVADIGWFAMFGRPYRSYEVSMSNLSFSFNVLMDRRDPGTGTVVRQASEPWYAVGGGSYVYNDAARVLRWKHGAIANIVDAVHLVKITGGTTRPLSE
jgi:hypothetical protein